MEKEKVSLLHGVHPGWWEGCDLCEYSLGIEAMPKHLLLELYRKLF